MQGFGDAIKASSMRHWALSGRYGLVKVMSPAGEAEMKHKAEQRAKQRKPYILLLSGYFTLERYLWGLNALQIEAVLGLRSGELSQICRIYAFKRLPLWNEFDFRYSAAQPDGEFPEPSESSGPFDRLMQARADYAQGRHAYRGSQVPVIDVYNPGSAMIPQWRLRKDTEVPCGPRIANVTSQIVFPRPDGTEKPHRPYNRSSVA